MDRATAKLLREVLNTALENSDLKGYEFEVGNASYNDHEVTFKVVLRDADAMPKEERELVEFAKFYGLDTTKIFGKYTLVGYKTRARKNPWIVQDLKSGTKYVIGDDTAKQWFGKEA